MKVREYFPVDVVAGVISLNWAHPRVDEDAHYHGQSPLPNQFDEDDGTGPRNVYDGVLTTQRSVKVSGFDTPRSYTFKDVARFPDGMRFFVFTNNARVADMLREFNDDLVVLHIIQRAASCFEVLRVERHIFFKRDGKMCIEVESVGRRLIDIR